jgi:hypothetical protein
VFIGWWFSSSAVTVKTTASPPNWYAVEDELVSTTDVKIRGGPVSVPLLPGQPATITATNITSTERMGPRVSQPEPRGIAFAMTLRAHPEGARDS